jgi:hypothetical protein
MAPNTTTRRWRELFVLCSLALLLGGGAFLWLLLIGGGVLLSVLAALAALAVLGALHYLLWGRWLQRDAGGRGVRP